MTLPSSTKPTDGIFYNMKVSVPGVFMYVPSQRIERHHGAPNRAIQECSLNCPHCRAGGRIKIISNVADNRVDEESRNMVGSDSTATYASFSSDAIESLSFNRTRESSRAVGSSWYNNTMSNAVLPRDFQTILGASFMQALSMNRQSRFN